MRKFRNNGMSTWGAGMGVLGLLITAGLTIYLFSIMARSSINTLKSSEDQIDEIEQTLQDRADQTRDHYPDEPPVPQGPTSQPKTKATGWQRPIQHAKDIKSIIGDRNKRLEEAFEK